MVCDRLKLKQKGRFCYRNGLLCDVRQNVQLSHHFLDDMRILANLLKDFDEP